MQEMYEVCYENYYITARFDSTHEKEILRTSEELIVYKGDLKSCLDYLKAQMIDATRKLFNEADVNISKHSGEYIVRLAISVSESNNEEFKSYESNYYIHC